MISDHVALISRKSICSRAKKIVEALSLDVDLAHIMADDLKSLVCGLLMEHFV